MCEEFNNHLNKCRFCFKTPRTIVEICEKVEKYFAALTSFELKIENCFSKKSCITCHRKLSEFYDFKLDLVNKQIRLNDFMKKNSVDFEAESYCWAGTSLQVKADYEIESENIETETSDDIEDEEQFSIIPPNEDFPTSAIVPVDIEQSHKKSTENTVEVNTDGSKENISENHVFKPKNLKFDCSSCQNSYSNSSNLNKHLRKIHKIFECQFCPSQFNKPYIYAEHLSAHSKAQMEKIAQQKKDKIQQEKDLINQKIQQEKDKEQERQKSFRMCPYCGEILKSLHFLQQNINLKHDDHRKWICDVCGKEITNDRTSMENHMEVHYRTKTFECAICAKKLFSKAGLKLHLNEIHAHELHGEHECHCGKVFSTPHKLKAHQIKVHLENTQKCKDCPKTFKNNTAYWKHKSYAHSEKIPCEICGKLMAKYFMAKHLKTHQPPQLKCKFKGCQKIYHFNQQLQIHIQRMHGKKAKCKQCKVTFKSKIHLETHMRNQHREKDLKCEVEGCGYKAIRRDYMMKHYNRHKNINEETKKKFVNGLKDRRST